VDLKIRSIICSIMADQLLEQVRELAEGQIVSHALNIVAAIQLIVLSTGFRRAEALRALGDGFTCCDWGTFLLLGFLNSNLMFAVGFCVCYRLYPPRYHARSLYRPRRNSTRLHCHCASLAILQYKSCEMVASSWK
jgi:hypothetical protein